MAALKSHQTTPAPRRGWRARYGASRGSFTASWKRLLPLDGRHRADSVAIDVQPPDMLKLVDTSQVAARCDFFALSRGSKIVVNVQTIPRGASMKRILAVAGVRVWAWIRRAADQVGKAPSGLTVGSADKPPGPICDRPRRPRRPLHRRRSAKARHPLLAKAKHPRRWSPKAKWLSVTLA